MCSRRCPYLSRVWAMLSAIKKSNAISRRAGPIALEVCRHFLDTAGITYLASVLIGSIADKIVERASETWCAFIVVADWGSGRRWPIFSWVQSQRKGSAYLKVAGACGELAWSLPYLIGDQSPVYV